MQLTKQAITAIRESAECRREIQYQLEISHSTMYRLLDENKLDGKLTTARVLGIIRDTTGLSDEQILTTEKAEA
jgi:hypothetical protein